MAHYAFRSALLLTSILSTWIAVPAVAQDASGLAPQASVAEEESTPVIVVSGTRLGSSGFQAPTPVTVLGEATIGQRAPTTIAEIINELPSFRQSANNTQNQRGNGNGGQNRVDLRGLGDVRTLVLVDGKRFVPTNLTGTIDINLIPTAMVDRIEVVTGGASAAYGSDAVSGVVNFILKDSLEGVVGSAQYGISNEGDNKEPGISLAAGSSFSEGRGHIIIGGDFNDNKGVGTLYTREWGRKQPCLVSFGALAARGASPAQGYGNNCTYSTQSDGALINTGPLKGTAFGPGGTPFAFQYGTVYSNLMLGGQGGPDGNPFGNWLVRAPNRRYTGMFKVSYEVSDALSLYSSFNFARIEGDGLSSYHQAAALIVPITNPFIPASVRTQMVANNLTSITVGRYETQLGGYRLRATNTIARGVFGAKGKLDGGGNWAYDIYYEHGNTDGHQRIFTNIFEGNYLAATYVVTDPATGQPACGPLTTNPNLTAARRAQVLPGCVPFNIFGRESPSEAAKAYITYEGNNHTHYTEDNVSANITGEPFSTWAGPVSFAAGFDHRYDRAYSKADEFGASLVALSNNGSTYSGGVKINEGYAELGVPLIRDASFSKSLDVNGAIRRTHYSTSGSVTTWKLGAVWEPIDALRLRVTRSRDIRAANITELFVLRNVGITASFLNPINNRTGPINTITGGNPSLQPEVASTWTAGVVFQPNWAWAQGFRASVDYFDVNIKGVIASVAAADIASRCAQGLPEYCALIVFDSSPSGISTISVTPANLNRLVTKGFDIEADYRTSLDAFGLPGKLSIRTLNTITTDLTTIDAVLTTNRAGSGALGGVPRWTSNTTLSYQLGRLTNTLQLKYTSAIRGDASLFGPTDVGYNPALTNSINVNHFPAAAYVNYTVQYDLLNEDNRSLQLFALVNNVFNKDPADFAIVAFASGGNPYDVIGRTFKAGVRFKF
jgi:iron complex outermembrane receptor protein